MKMQTVYPRPGQSLPELARELLPLARLGGYRRDAVRHDPSGGFTVPSQVAQAWVQLSQQATPAARPATGQEPASEAPVEGGQVPDTPPDPTPAPGSDTEPPDTDSAEPKLAAPAPPAVTEKSAAAETRGGIGAERPRKRTAASKATKVPATEG